MPTPKRQKPWEEKTLPSASKSKNPQAVAAKFAPKDDPDLKSLEIDEQDFTVPPAPAVPAIPITEFFPGRSLAGAVGVLSEADSGEIIPQGKLKGCFKGSDGRAFTTVAQAAGRARIVEVWSKEKWVGPIFTYEHKLAEAGCPPQKLYEGVTVTFKGKTGVLGNALELIWDPAQLPKAEPQAPEAKPEPKPKAKVRSTNANGKQPHPDSDASPDREVLQVMAKQWTPHDQDERNPPQRCASEIRLTADGRAWVRHHYWEKTTDWRAACRGEAIFYKFVGDPPKMVEKFIEVYAHEQFEPVPISWEWKGAANQAG